jgi:hypothetical protein
LAKKPTEPFQVKFVQAKPGDKQLPAEWAVPFDEEFRPIETPNAPDLAHAAYASIGWHVAQHTLRYCPAYRVLDTLNLRKAQAPNVMAAWEKKTTGQLTITNRKSGIVSWIVPSVSVMEAVIAWFVREVGNDGQVLCHDAQEGIWYTDAQRSDLTVWLNAEGQEAAQGEGTQSHYLTDKHPNAIMSLGE